MWVPEPIGKEIQGKSFVLNPGETELKGAYFSFYFPGSFISLFVSQGMMPVQVPAGLRIQRDLISTG